MAVNSETPVAGATGDQAAAPATDAAASAAPAAEAAAAAAPAPGGSDGAVAPAGEAKPADQAQPAPAEAKADAAPAEPKSAPSLLETANSKPKDAPADKTADAKPEAAKDGTAPADAAKPDATKDAKTEGDKKPDAKAAEAKKDEADKKADPATEATAAAQPPAPIKYEPFKVPDGIKLDETRLSQFTEIAGAAQIKQEDAQKFFDLHVSEMKNYATEVANEQRRVWDKLNDSWKNDFRKDEKLGGNRAETTLARAKAVVEEYGGTPDQVRDLLAHTTNNGMGNYPGFIRLLDNIAGALNVFEDSLVPANTAPKPGKSAGNRGWYDS